jgi:DNA-binding response OmpR family regulator
VRPPAARVLIVEDDEATSQSYAYMLRLEGFAVRTALSAEAGLHDVESNPPDAIVLDLRMPVVDGLEFLRRLRARDESRDTPVAIVTGDYALDDAIAARLVELGARVRYKPLWIEDLSGLVQELLERA